MNRVRESGQTLPLIVLFMLSLLGMSALVVDVGAWKWNKEDMQAHADAAALASTSGIFDGTYASLAAHNFSLNAKPGETATYQRTSLFTSNDSVLVTVQADKPTYVAKIFGFQTVHVQVQARATAQSITAETGQALPLALFGEACMPGTAGTPVVLYGGNDKCGSSSSNAGTVSVPDVGQTAGDCGSYNSLGNGQSTITGLMEGSLSSGTMRIGGCLVTKTGNGSGPGTALTGRTFPFATVIPVLSIAADQGHQGEYRIIAFVWVQVTGCSGGIGASSCNGPGGKEIDGITMGPYDGDAAKIETGQMIPGYVNLLGLTA